MGTIRKSSFFSGIEDRFNGKDIVFLYLVMDVDKDDEA
jgi:hypothetical protein